MNKQWDLTILYNGFDDPKMAEDMTAFDKAIADVIAFSESLDALGAEELLLKHIALETEISNLAEKLFIYANLRYSANTADSEAASIVGVLMGKLSATAAASAAIRPWMAAAFTTAARSRWTVASSAARWRWESSTAPQSAAASTTAASSR